MAKDTCCPAPSELRLYRHDTSTGPSTPLTITVPAGKILVVTSWITHRINSNIGLKLLRNTEVVAERYPNDQNAGELYNMIFPTGIAFAAGEDLVIDHTYVSNVSIVYGYETDA